MYLRELIEGVTQIWAKKGNKQVRRYRCTSGTRKGRVVAKASTCSAPRNVSSSIAITKAKRSKAGLIKAKTRRTKAQSGVSRRVAKLNRPTKKRFSGKRKRI